jgi:ABC-2 type transport system permease protein
MSSRKAIGLVARREFTERVRERSFHISTAISLVILLAVILIPKAFDLGGPDVSHVGLLGPKSAALEPYLAVTEVDGEPIETVSVSGAAAAEQALRDGDLDAVVVEGRRILSEEDVSDELEAAIQGASVEARARAALEDAGLDETQAEAILRPPLLATDTLEPEDEGGDSGVALVAVIVLYGQLFGYAFWVASGVVEEKASRIVEILLAAINARQLLAGKVIGIGVLGFVQLIGIAAVALAAAIAVDVVDDPGRAIGSVLIALAWFVLGFAFYACLFAVAGATISRVEEVQNATTPLTVVILGSFALSFVAINDPDGALAQVASIVPPISAMVMPPRIVAGDVAAWEIGLAVVLMIAATCALVPVAARLYSNAVLRTGGRVRLRDAWRPAGA